MIITNFIGLSAGWKITLRFYFAAFIRTWNAETKRVEVNYFRGNSGVGNG